MSDTNRPKTAVFLMNLGGPRNLGEVRSYLFELFADKKILQIPGVVRLPLAFLISTLRAPSSRSKYALIGDGSPLVAGTYAQAQALETMLGPEFSCHPTMRCGHPSTKEAVAEALQKGAQRAVALTLYPQYARPTTLSSLEELRKRWPKTLPIVEVERYGTDPLYLDATEACLREALAQLTPEQARVRLVCFSAHGLPMRDIRAGDPYEAEVKATAAALAARCGLAEDEWMLTYQSRVRPREWLGPDTEKTVRAKAHGRAMVMVPVSFVSEHLETLYDINILAREAAEAAGALTVVRAMTPGARPEFIRALAAQVEQALSHGSSGLAA